MAFDLTEGQWYKEQIDKEQAYISFEPAIIKEAKQHGIKFGTADFMVYQYIRWCETSPRAKFPVMVAGIEHIKERFGFEKAEDVRNSLNHLMKIGAVCHIDYGERFYRAKTKVWISAEKAKMLGKYVDGSTKNVDGSTNPSPVLPLGERTVEKTNNIKLNNNNYQNASASTLDVATQPTTPPTAVAVNPNSGFFSADSKDTRKEGGVVKNTTLSDDDPFKNDIDLKKDARTKDKMRENAKAAVIATNLLNAMGKSSKRPGGKLISMVKARLAEGYTEREMALAVSRGMKVDFYKTSGIFNMLSERGMDNLLNDKWFKAETDKQKYDSIQSHLM